jgi:hypothetical protein
MEFLTILLSALIGVISPAGLIVDSIAENAIRDQFCAVEELAVRVDNAPSHQLLQGRVDRVRIAGRGFFPLEAIRIAALEVETDAIDVDLGSLQAGELELEQPLQAGVRLVLTQADLNRALQAPRIRELLNDLNFGSLVALNSDPSQTYEVVDPQIDLLDNQRIRIQAVLQAQQTEEQLAIVLESGLAVQSGQRILFIDPIVTVNQEAFPTQLIEQLAAGISRQYDLSNFQEDGITARILELELTPDQLQLAAFVRLEPAAIDSED